MLAQEYGLECISDLLDYLDLKLLVVLLVTRKYL
jgi:hypothetical protein